jgi:dienelactone hydrolase
VTISDNNENILFTDSIFGGKHWARCISSFQDGNYRFRLKIKKYSIVQEFYKGDVIESTRKVIKAILLIKTTNRIRDNIDALIFRFHHLQKNTWPGDPKYVLLFTQLNEIYHSLKKGINPFHHTSGSFIRSYISDIDSSKQYYILHVPSTYRMDNPLPVMTVMPVSVGELPYLKSFRVANVALSKRFQDLAEKYKTIVAEFGSRRSDKPNFNTIEETEFFNIINDIKKDYNINPKRFYLTGACIGGNDALKMAIKYPGRFAAIGIISPDINYTSNDGNPWLKQNEIVPFIKNIVNTPTLDIHCSIDRHVPVAVSDKLSQIAEDEKLKYFSYKRLKTEYVMYYADDYFDDVFDFCHKFSLNTSPKEIEFSTSQMIYNKSFWITLKEIESPSMAHIHATINDNTLAVSKKNILVYSIDLKTLPYDRDRILKIIDNGKQVFNAITNDSVLSVGSYHKTTNVLKNNLIAGPFAHVFAQKFIVVKGTSGSKAETTKLKALADTINKYWNERYFVPCNIKNDFEISENDIAGSNLILLGNYESDLILKKLLGNIPLKISRSGIQISNKKIDGENLCFYMIYPNPLNKTRYVAIIGYNNPDNISLGSETGSFDDVSNYGWYDYKVWDSETREKGLTFGYFNSYWEL